MTEAGAEQRWCPFASSRVVTFKNQKQGTTQVTFEPEEVIDRFPSTTCVASQCMAWRWSVRVTSPGAEHLSERFCGLAGKP